MFKKSTLFLSSGIMALVYSIYAFANYYTLSGVDLLEAKEAKRKIKMNDIEYIIDVRSQTEWNLGHYPGALHIPVTELKKEKMPKNSIDKGILVYCNTGQRARLAAETLKALGYNKVYYIAGTYSSII